MFYADEKIDVSLRLGDVLVGLPICTPTIIDPDPRGGIPPFTIDARAPAYFAVLTPCCSIANCLLAVAPLREISPKFHQNPHFIEDFTRLNRPMPASKMVPPKVWDDMAQAVREQKFDLEKDGYAFTDFFVYAPHQLLAQYSLNKKGGAVTTGHYMVDFKTVYQINWPKATSPDKAITEAKTLQLSIEARQDLRLKFAAFYSRPADADII